MHCEGRRAVSEKRKEKKKKRTIRKLKLKRGVASSVGCGTAHPRTRCEATSRHAPGPGGEGGVSQSDGGRGSRRVAEEGGGEGNRGRCDKGDEGQRDTWQRTSSGETCEIKSSQ